MAKFKFKAININGEKYKGTREAVDKFALYSEFKAEGETLISAEEISVKSTTYFVFSSFFKRVPEHQKITFVKNLGEMIDAGLPIAKALIVINKQIKNAYFKEVISSLIEKVRRGVTLSQASSEHKDVFGNLFTSMVRAGEESGNLAGSLKIVGDQMEASDNLRRKVKGAMIYPGVILTLMVIIGIAMLIYVIPSVTATFTGLNIELPASTRFFINASDFVKNNILVCLIIFIILFVIYYFFSKSKKGKRFIDFAVLNLPIVSPLVKEINLARISRTISSLLSSGVAFSESLRITEAVIENHYFKDLLVEAKQKIEKGETISSVFLEHEKLASAFVGEMMSVGEETGKLPKMLMEVAEYYEKSVDQKTKDMSTVIEPVLMIIIGVAVGFFAFAIIKPIYSITSSIQ